MEPELRTSTARSSFIYGTVVTAFIALLLATPLSIAIALFLTEIAPRRLAAPIATMVELLAAIPSVVLGLWGILVFGPVGRGPPRAVGSSSWLGFLPIFSGEPVPGGMLPAALVLTIMIIPITSAICRELFSRVPRDLTDGSLALGSTQLGGDPAASLFRTRRRGSRRPCCSGSGARSARRSP